MTLKRHTHRERETITGRKVDDGKGGMRVQVSASRRRAGADRIKRAGPRLCQFANLSR
jgi:hypothetical protein